MVKKIGAVATNHVRKNWMKLLTVALGLVVVFGACKKEDRELAQKNGTVVWNSKLDRPFATNIDVVQNDSRKNASGEKITSNSHNAKFPGIFFIWDAKHQDNGYLKVAASMFDEYCSFVLTSKEANTFWDFKIQPVKGQQKTADNCYVFFIPRAQNNKNINMVFIDESTFVKHIPCECCGQCTLCDPCFDACKCPVCKECECICVDGAPKLTNFNWNHSQSNDKGGNPGVNSFKINNIKYQKAPAGEEVKSLNELKKNGQWVLTNYTEVSNKIVVYEITLLYGGKKYELVVTVYNWGGNENEVEHTLNEIN